MGLLLVNLLLAFTLSMASIPGLRGKALACEADGAIVINAVCVILKFEFELEPKKLVDANQ